MRVAVAYLLFSGQEETSKQREKGRIILKFGMLELHSDLADGARLFFVNLTH